MTPIQFRFQDCALKSVALICPKLVTDQRGYLSKPFDKAIFEANGIRFEVEEELESGSSHSTLRGLHFQRRHSQDKLVRVLSGEVYDVVVDLRPESPTFDWPLESGTVPRLSDRDRTFQSFAVFRRSIGQE